MFRRAVRTASTVGSVLLLGACGGSDDKVSAIEEALAPPADLQFNQLTDSTDLSCRRNGSFRDVPAFRCTFNNAGGELVEQRWTLQGGDNAGRISEGGQEGSAPRDASDAAARLSPIFSARIDQVASTTCQPVGQGLGKSFSCTIIDSALGPDPETRILWGWWEDGTVATERLDFETRNPSLDVSASSDPDVSSGASPGATPEPSDAAEDPEDDNGPKDCGNVDSNGAYSPTVTVARGDFACDDAVGVAEELFAARKQDPPCSEQGCPDQDVRAFTCAQEEGLGATECTNADVAIRIE